MAPKTDEYKDKTVVPGPGSYESGDVNKVKDQLPAFSMGAKFDLPVDKTPKPAPNAYTPDNCLMDHGPKFTMSSKTQEYKDKTVVPGPGTYESGNVNKVKEELPAFSMGEKFELPKDKTTKPAPNAYTPEQNEIQDKSPEYTFGMKHSQYLGKLRAQ